MSTNTGMDKEQVVHMYNGILFSNKKEWNLAIWDMDGPREYHAKWNMSNRERQMPYDFTHMWNRNKQKQVSKETQNRDRSIESKLMMVAKEEVDGAMEIKNKNK